MRHLSLANEIARQMNAVHRGLIALVVPCLLFGSTHPEGASLDIYHIERYRVHVIGEHFAIDGLIDGLIIATIKTTNYSN